MKRALLLIAVLGATARADDHPQGPVGPVVIGEKLYKEGHYAEAAKEFEKAYELSPTPQLLFNIAQSYRFANDCAAAATYYRKFVAQVKDAPNLDKVQKYIAEMDACVAAQTRTKPAPPPPPPPESSPAPSPAVIVPPPAAEPADPGATKRHVGLALGVVGIASLATGVYFTHQVGVAENDRTALEKQCVGLAAAMSPTFTTTCAGSKFTAIDDRGNHDQTLAIATYAVGGVAVAAGIALYVLGRDHGSEHVAVVPTPGGAYASVGYAF